MFTKSERFYDAVYSWKDYAREAAELKAVIRARKRSPGRALLDVACGTGGHVPYLKDELDIEGLDLDPAMIEIARARHPGIPFHVGDMTGFDLGRRFDVVVTLFSSIGYARTVPRLNAAIACMARHVAPGGLLIVEPFFTPEAWNRDVKLPSMNVVERPDLKLVRMTRWQPQADHVVAEFHYLVGLPDGTIEHLVEPHVMGLFTVADTLSAFATAGLAVEHDEKGLMGRGLYIGIRPH